MVKHREIYEKNNSKKRRIPRQSMRGMLSAHRLAVFTLGLVSQIGQVLLLRELLMVFHGNELSIGIILAAWMAWVGVGSRIGASLAGRTTRPRLLLALSGGGLVFALPSSILLIRSLRDFFALLPGSYLSLADMAVSCVLVTAPVCLLLGLQFVLLSRIWREHDRLQTTSGAAKTYIGEAWGNMVGGILFAVLIVHHLNAFQAAFLVSVLMLVIALRMAHKTRVHLSMGQLSMLFILLAATAFLFPLLEPIDRWAHELRWRTFAPRYDLQEIHQSKYGLIAVLQHEDQYSFYQSGHLLFSTAGPQTKTPGLEEQEAASFAHLAMVQHKNPEQVLLIGGGLRGTLGEIARHPVQRIDYIELDAVLTKAALPYISPSTLEALNTPRVRTIHTDGRLFVKTAGTQYDMIIVDIPDPTTAVLNRYYTREFFREARDLLKPEGVFIISADTTPDMRGQAVANRNTAIFHTLSSIFPQVLSAGDRHLYFIASDTDEQITVDVPSLQERYRRRGIQSDGFSAHHYQVLIQEPQLRRVSWILHHHGRSPNAHLEGPATGPIRPDPVPEQVRAARNLPPVQEAFFINSDLKPIGYFYTLIFWNELTGSNQAAILQHLLRVRFSWFVAFFLLPPAVVLGLGVKDRRTDGRRAPYFAVHFAAFATGLSTMALQIALLFSFQSIYGFVYELVGLIVAVFMGGLALGAWVANRRVQDKDSIRTLAGVQLIMAGLAALIGGLLPQAALVRAPAIIFLLFSLLTFLAGLLNGIDFPLAAACSLAITRQAERSAGTVYAIELFGACLGAVLASVLMAPILGIVACCYFAALASGTACLVLLVSERWSA